MCWCEQNSTTEGQESKGENKKRFQRLKFQRQHLCHHHHLRVAPFERGKGCFRYDGFQVGAAVAHAPFRHPGAQARGQWGLPVARVHFDNGCYIILGNMMKRGKETEGGRGAV